MKAEMVSPSILTRCRAASSLVDHHECDEMRKREREGGSLSPGLMPRMSRARIPTGKSERQLLLTKNVDALLSVVLLPIFLWGGCLAQAQDLHTGPELLCPVEVSFLRQSRAEVAIQSEGVADRGPSHGTGFPFLDRALELLRDHYVRDLADTEIYQKPLERLAFVLLPHCLEDVETVDQCRGPADQCLGQAIRSIARHCNIAPELVAELVLKNLANNLDANSGLLDAELLKELTISTSGRFGGVGMAVDFRDHEYVVISPFDDSPALKAGIRAGDRIIAIGGHSLDGLSLMEVLRMVRGPVGSVMTATVKDRHGRVGEVRMQRQPILIPPVRWLRLSHGIGYVRIVNFQTSTYHDLRKALVQLFRSGPNAVRGLILDLRDNAGGLFEEAIQVANLFLSSGVITSVRGRNANLNRDFPAASEEAFPEVPMVVLINKGTASASEVLAGALQGRPNVVIMGGRSFGKASVQAVFSLKKEMALRLTTAHYYTPDGRNIDGKGLEPDIRIDSPGGLTKAKIGLSNPEEVEKDPEIKQAFEQLVHGVPVEPAPVSPLF